MSLCAQHRRRRADGSGGGEEGREEGQGFGETTLDISIYLNEAERLHAPSGCVISTAAFGQGTSFRPIKTFAG